MSERLEKKSGRQRLYLCALLSGVAGSKAYAATLNPVVLPACPTQGVYQEVNDAGVADAQFIWYVPYRIGLDPQPDSVSVFTWQEASEDWLSVSMNLRLLASDNVERCI
ncbi:MAG: hypothetical protein M3Q07_25360, partial [Pseudobdellovibrionaceae bacterium]|nr:hypothetical protein [Pseudobdellovibrionaceae bacterium]